MTILTTDLEAAAASGLFQPLTTERFFSKRFLMTRYLGWTDAELDEAEGKLVETPSRMGCRLSWTEEEILECERLWQAERAAVAEQAAALAARPRGSTIRWAVVPEDAMVPAAGLRMPNAVLTGVTMPGVPQ